MTADVEAPTRLVATPSSRAGETAAPVAGTVTVTVTDERSRRRWSPSGGTARWASSAGRLLRRPGFVLA
ncbi:MAG: hypothetical protein ACRYG2_29860, partial [Janthinobacterium lividum]